MSADAPDPVEVNFPEDAIVKLGVYTHTCRRCRVMFNGHKHRTLCRVCDAEDRAIQEEAKQEADALRQWESPEVFPMVHRGFVRGYCAAAIRYRKVRDGQPT